MLKFDTVTKTFFFLFIFSSLSLADCNNFAEHENSFKYLKYINLKIHEKEMFFKKAARYYIAVNKGDSNARKFQERLKKKLIQLLVLK